MSVCGDMLTDDVRSHAVCLEVITNVGVCEDLYLEGSDKHRGWVQYAVGTSVEINNSVPYKTAMKHGFTECHSCFIWNRIINCY